MSTVLIDCLAWPRAISAASFLASSSPALSPSSISPLCAPTPAPIPTSTPKKLERVHINHRYYRPREIGRGTSSVVYEAYDCQSKSIVALKMFLPEWVRDSSSPLSLSTTTKAEMDAINTGRHEVRALRAAAALSPHIVPVLDSFVAPPLVSSSSSSSSLDETMYYVMPCAVRGTLERLMFGHLYEHDRTIVRHNRTKRRRVHDDDTTAVTSTLLDYALVERFARQLVDAVAAVHRAGYLHLDIKPDNVLVMRDADDADDYVLLADFSHAFPLPKTTARAPGLTTSPVSTATAHNGDDDNDRRSVTTEYSQMTLWYRAPEACRGDTHYDVRSDAWSLGTVVAEMITGTRAWPLPSVEDVVLAHTDAFASHADVDDTIGAVERTTNDPRAKRRKMPSAIMLDARITPDRRRACPHYLIRLLDSMLEFERTRRLSPARFART